MNCKIEKLYLQHSKKMYYWLLRRTKNKTIAEDLLSHGWEKIIAKKASLKDKSKMKAWAWQIIVNTFNQYQRDLKPCENAEDFYDIPDYSLGVLEQVCSSESYKVGFDALKKLNPIYKKAIMDYMYERPLAEVALKRKINPMTAGVRLFNAKQKIRELCASEVW